ncbi:UDP-N-acetylglucosamine 2-epimerase (non-hydrolyzing) [Aureibaculum sp. 2210JD6-5]|uniref:non-hydrolyzing UDP-N-acetylglucosamine 2-epimerase n=1 Tax=Aureibaculum sp. 2210JD6-5 TaxID=3103957 RepID=UPI002AACB6BC|nr:UDP-N-acetylglucosamine 2-epimerase (non-hydrolyzing) [Aureibaculum sp. 2210JD6-5]MDY7394092.1 UDP-N-acetylglucosamine 2-epimerase (non-hydrolyzing) [Aureibaculum sp. 2210JD6-5]
MEYKKLKIATVVGTRPEIIRLSSTIKRIDDFLEQIIIHTGQNYDYELNEIFFKDLGLRKPNYFLEVNTSSLGRVLGETLMKSEEVFKKEKPDAVLILGDTNASIVGIIAKRMRIPIFHMEAGNRSFDMNVPEEINRRIIDHVADFNLVYTEHARRHLLSEGLPHRRIYLTGSPMLEVLKENEEKINNSEILDKLQLKEKQYFIVSTHREENVDNKNHLKQILSVLNTLAKSYDIPIIVSTHPRTRKRLEVLTNIQIDKKIQFLKPFGFYDYIKLQKESLCAISDSGTISEESAMLSFPAISLRQSMERPEAQDTGTIILTGFNPDVILNSIETVIKEQQIGSYKEIPQEYQILNTSWRVLKLIMGNAGLSNRWWGINKKD